MNIDEIRQIIWDWGQKRAEALEIFAFEKEGLKIEKKDGKLETFQPFREEGLAIRVLKNQAFGFSYTTDFHLDSLLDTAERALEMALVMERDPELSLPFPGEIPDLRFSPTPLLSPEESLARLERIEKAAFAFDSKVSRLQEVGLREQKGSFWVANTNGIDLSWNFRNHSLMVVAVAEGEGEAQMGWEWRMALSPEDLSPEEIGRKAAQRAVWRLGGRKLPSTKVKVLLPPHVAVDFLELLSEALRGDRVLKGKSPLGGKVGEKVFSDLINIVDHGLLEGGLETRPFDDEGVPQKEKKLINEGYLQGFLFDHYWGKKSGHGSTGNARRMNFKTPPGVGLTNFYLVPGETESSLLREGKVFEVLEVLGMHTADPVSGDFSVGVSGLFYEGGNFQPVSGMALAGNIFEVFQKVEAVGNDLTFYGSVGAPSLLISEMDLSGG